MDPGTCTGSSQVERSRLALRAEPAIPFEARDLPEALARAAALGRRLWSEALAAAQGEPRDLDDRRLYWARLAALDALDRWSPPEAPLEPEARRALCAALESASRGYDEKFSEQADLRLLVSGFDPFLLDPESGGPGAIHRANPSGAAVLALAGRVLEVGGLRAELRGAILPVRYEDFDRGVVEAFLGPRLLDPPDLVMTISQGRGEDFAVEQWAGRRRSAPAPDNARRWGGGSETAPVTAPGLGPGPEFLATTLPCEAIWAALGRAGPAPYERTLCELGPAGEPALGERPGEGTLAVRGSGGGYLSNEIFYRAARLRLERGLSLPLGHLHTPFLAPPLDGPSDPGFEAARARIVDGVERVLRGLIPALDRRRT